MVSLVNEFIPKVSNKEFEDPTFAIGAKINGMKKIGFNKTQWSTEQDWFVNTSNVGTTDARPLHGCFDFVNHEHEWNDKSRTSTTHSNDKHLST